MKIIPSPENLTIQLQGLERFFALRSKITIPREKIVRMQFHGTFENHGRTLLRVGGTGAPGLLYAGNFRSEGLPFFLYVQRPKGWQTLHANNILEFAAQNEGFSETTFLLTVPPEEAQELLTWYNAR